MVVICILLILMLWHSEAIDEEPIAVSASDFKRYGCVYCGHRYCYPGPIKSPGTTPVTCNACGESFIILADGVPRSDFVFGDSLPELQPHPRRL